MNDHDKKRKTKGFRSSSATTTSRTPAAGSYDEEETADETESTSHVLEESTTATPAPSTMSPSNNHRRAPGKGGGKGGARAVRDPVQLQVPPAPMVGIAPSTPKTTSQQTGSSNSRASLTSQGLESGVQSASSAAVYPKVESTSDEAWLSVDLDAVDIDTQFVSTTTVSSGGGGGGNDGPLFEAPPDSPSHPAGATRLTLQEVHGLPGAFMSTTTGHYVNREAEAIRQLLGEDSGLEDDRSSTLREPQPQPQQSRPTANDDPLSFPQEVPPASPEAPSPVSPPLVIQGSVNEILVEARPVSRSRSFNSEDEYYSYGSGDLASDDRLETADALPSAHVQRRNTRRGARASRLLSLRLQLGEMGLYGGGGGPDDLPPILVDARPIPKRSRAQVWMMVGVGALAVVAALAVGLSLGLTRPTSSSDGETNNAAPTPAPTPAPTSSLAGQLRSSLPASTQAALEDATSSQSQAFQYVVSHSTATDATNGSNTGSVLERMTQQFALLTLFYSTTGKDWISPWIDTTTTSTAGELMSDECLWAGITCDGNRTVVQLLLAKNFLSGPVPPEIALLPHLADVNLASNPQLNGTLPSEIGALTRLTNLALSGDRLSGRLPTELGNLIALTSLTLSTNDFTGPLPTELGRLTRLTDLSITQNNFTSSIPTQIGFLTLLNKFDVNDNAFTSTIPTEVGLLMSATTFRAHSNKLTGQLPTEIGRLSRLTVISTFNSALVGTIPTELGNLVGLTKINLDTSGLVGTLPTELGRLTNAVDLWLFRNNLQGTVPTELGNMVKLESLNVSTNQLNGTIPPHLGNLTSLKGLNIAQSLLTGPIPTELAQISSLRELHLYWNQLTGTVPTIFGSLPSLTELGLFGNSLTGTIPTTSDLCQRALSGQLYMAVECADVPCNETCGCHCGPW